MLIYELHTMFNFLLDKASSGSYPDVPQEQRDRFFNLAIERFIKERYNGLNLSRTAFEETTKRRDDLSVFISSSILESVGDGYGTGYGAVSKYYQLPADYWITVAEMVEIKSKVCNGFKLQPVLIARHNQLLTLLEDPFNRPSGIRTLSVQESFNDITVKQLFYDRTSTILNYRINYIKQYKKLLSITPDNVGLYSNTNYVPVGIPTYHTLPQITAITITINNVNYTVPSWKNTDFWVSLESHQEIVNIAVAIALEVLESPRQQTYTNIVAPVN